jgi:hypothetical protein
MPTSILDITNAPTNPTQYPGPGFTYQFSRGTVRTDRNVQPGNSAQQLTGLAALSLASNLGIPQVGQVGQSVIGQGNYDVASQYNAVPFINLNKLPGIAYQDFRARKGFDSVDLISKRLDGGAAAVRRGQIRNRWIAAAYAAASASPAGAYSIFNRDGNTNFGAGWGDHGNIYALRNDFTAQSHVATRWDKNDKIWKPTRDPLSIATAFRGDRVQVIDFGNRSLHNAYQWNPLGEAILGTNILNQTQDFIKFFITGPKLSPSAKSEKTITDEIIVFRASIGSLTDSFNPSWTPVNLPGRADPNYQYSGYSRNIQLTFDVYATDRDEMKPVWRKLNALAGYTAPTYNPDSIALEAPWMRITIGDLFYQQPVIMSSLTYTLQDSDTTWEINIEQDAAMMQAPKKISVTMGLNIIANELPQKGGRFYTLAKQFDETSQSLPGTDNWLSDSRVNEDSINIPEITSDVSNNNDPSARTNWVEKFKERRQRLSTKNPSSGWT